MRSPSSLRDLLPVPPPCLIIIAPSSRAPDYEMQSAAISGSALDSSETLPAIIELLVDGHCRVNGDAMDDRAAVAIRERLDVGEDDFRLLVVDATGHVVRTFDAPVKATAIREALESERGEA